ncbi:MAG: hypothetical protein K2R98_04935 [Gemmataceae bacterium]|nr:hypothetical protein [Gemmataceae bacterium]
MAISRVLLAWFAIVPVAMGAPASYADEMRTLTKQRSEIQTMSLSKDGTTLAISVHDFVTLWDVRTLEKIGETRGEPIRFPFSGHSPIRSAVFSPDGKSLVGYTMVYQEIKDRPGVKGWDAIPFVAVWDCSTKKELRRMMKGHYIKAISLDNKTIACVSAEEPQSDIVLCDFTTGKERGALKGHNSYIETVAFSADGQLLASGCFSDKTVRVWDVAKQKEWISFDAPERGGALAFSPDGTQIAIGGYRPIDANIKDKPFSVVKVYDVSPKTAWIPLIVNHYDVHSIQFSPDGKVLAVGTGGRDVEVWDLKKREKRTVFQVGRGPKHLLFTPDGKTLIVARGDTVELWPVPKE